MLAWLKARSLEMLGRVVRSALGDERLVEMLGGGPRSKAGQIVDKKTALTVAAVYRAVELYGNTHGTLPLGVYSKGGSRRKYYDTHPAHKVLHSKPNPEMTAMTMWKLSEVYRLLGGAFYAEIEWKGNGDIKYLWPLEPWRVYPDRNPETDVLKFIVDGKREVERKDMVHVPNFSWCGFHGQPTIEFARESLGRTLAAGENASETFAAGGVPPGWFRHPTRMEKPARDAFRKEMRENNIKDKGAIGILWENMDYVKSGLSAKDMEFLGTLHEGVLDVARFFNVPPHMLMDLERAINNNAEVGDVGFAKYSMLPVCVTYEQELNDKVLDDDFYCKHSLEGLLRGDHASRATWYREMRGIGVYSANDVCDFEDMDPVPGPEGDVRVINGAYIPLNMLQPFWEAKSKSGTVPNIGPDGKVQDDPPNQPPPKQPAKPKRSLETDPFYRSELARMQRREHKALRKAAKHPAEFLKWMDDFYERHSEVLGEVLYQPVSNVLELADPATVSEAVGNLVTAYVSQTKAGLLAASEVTADRFESAILKFIDDREGN